MILGHFECVWYYIADAPHCLCWRDILFIIGLLVMIGKRIGIIIGLIKVTFEFE